MPVDFRNTNTLWASVAVETLFYWGLRVAVVCPGSRSAPLAIAFAQHPGIEAIPILDERSASFFALGVARRQHQPVALVCTSGTAGANFYPAVIEAHESQVPLLILTADRPPELRDCNAGQAIDQQKLYGSFANWYHEVALPSPELPHLAYLRQTMVQACDRAQFPHPGPVHLNFPFRDPLVPLPQAEAAAIAQRFPPAFFSAVRPTAFQSTGVPPSSIGLPLSIPPDRRGILVAGPAQPADPHRYCEAIAHLSQTLGFPVLAEALSPLRNYAALNPYLISTYDLLLRDRALATELAPDFVIRIGEMPTSKELRLWLQHTQPEVWAIDEGDRNLDPLHLRTIHLPLCLEQLVATLPCSPPLACPPSPYLKSWCHAEEAARRSLQTHFAAMEELLEGKVAWLLSQTLPENTPLFIANSTPIRDMEWFWQPGDRHIQPYFNRGANGIDGTLSTALGITHAANSQPTVLLTGDLALLHDTNGFLIQSHCRGHLTIVLINNNGGGIFEILPVSQFDPPFEEFFATPQNVDFAKLCATYGVDYEHIQSWQHLAQRVSQLPQEGIRVLEVKCDRKQNARWLQENLPKFGPSVDR